MYYMLYSSLFSAVKEKMNGWQKSFGCYIERQPQAAVAAATRKRINRCQIFRKVDFHR
jgi:hypothetical protein